MTEKNIPVYEISKKTANKNPSDTFVCFHGYILAQGQTVVCVYAVQQMQVQ